MSNHDPEHLKTIIEDIVGDAQTLRWTGHTRTVYRHERPTHLDRTLTNTFGSRNGLNTLGETMIREGFEYAILNGDNIEIGLEYLKKRAGMPVGSIEVCPNNITTLDFSQINVASIDRLETGIAVATRKGMRGTISHLTIRYHLQSFFDLIDDEPRDVRVHLVGGYEMTDSEEYLGKVRGGLEDMGFRIAGMDVLEEPAVYRRLIMHTSGVIEVQHYKEYQRACDPLELITEINYLL